MTTIFRRMQKRDCSFRKPSRLVSSAEVDSVLHIEPFSPDRCRNHSPTRCHCFQNLNSRSSTDSQGNHDYGCSPKLISYVVNTADEIYAGCVLQQSSELRRGIPANHPDACAAVQPTNNRKHLFNKPVKPILIWEPVEASDKKRASRHF